MEIFQVSPHIKSTTRETLTARYNWTQIVALIVVNVVGELQDNLDAEKNVNTLKVLYIRLKKEYKNAPFVKFS